MRIHLKYVTLIVITLLSAGVQTAWAAGPPAPSLFDSPLAIVFVTLMLILLLIIGVLAYILISAGSVALTKRAEDEKARSQNALTAVLIFIFLFSGPLLFAQDKAEAAETGSKMVGGINSSAFYMFTGVVFLELLVILVLLLNIRVLLKREKEKAVAKVVTIEAKEEEKRTKLSWWDRFNKLRPVSQEAELDLGHEYDGIRELNNRLPPWWLYGFYASIVFAGIYLWRFHVSHTAPSSKEEYEYAVANAEQEIKEYLKAKGDAVDENTVVLLTTTDDLAAGKTIFVKSCAACHKETGAGDVGPNLTDNYWLHGNDIRDVFKTIRYGINAMPQWQNTYSNKEIALVASYVKSLHGSNPPAAKAPQGVEMKEDAVPGKKNEDSLGNKGVVTK
jgi:cytochrome c oxidase cbb3-type subunit 3